MKKYQLAVFIGRFQPLHHGHEKVINEALKIADKVLVLVGSADSARTLRNPFTYEERKDMIRNTFRNVNLYIAPINDYTYSDQKWIKSVHESIDKKVSTMGWSDYPKKVCLIGHNKDSTSYYLKLFPTFDNVNVSLYDECVYTDDGSISATIVRKFLFGHVGLRVREFVSPQTLKVIDKVRSDGHIKELTEERKWIDQHKKMWENSPYPPIFSTADAMVVQSGHVLVVRRKAFPSKGMLALAGGYLNQDETVVDGGLRELKEETKIDVPMKILRASIVTTKVFDNPNRSERGRIITHCTLIQLPDAKRLPKVVGSDDASEAFWLPLNEVSPKLFFEDHAFIIRKMMDYLK